MKFSNQIILFNTKEDYNNSKNKELILYPLNEKIHIAHSYFKSGIAKFSWIFFQIFTILSVTHDKYHVHVHSFSFHVTSTINTRIGFWSYHLYIIYIIYIYMCIISMCCVQFWWRKIECFFCCSCFFCGRFYSVILLEI